MHHKSYQIKYRISEFLAIAAGSFLTGIAGLHLSTFVGNAAPLWLQTGVSIALVFLFGPRVIPAIACGVFLAVLTTPLGLVTSFILTLANVSEMVLAKFFMRKYLDHVFPFGTVKGVVRFFIGCVLVIPAVSSTIGSLSLPGFFNQSVTQAAIIWMTWWHGNAMGCALVAPLIIAWTRPRTKHNPRWIESLIAGFGAVVLTSTIFEIFPKNPQIILYPATFLSIPFVVWTAVRSGMRVSVTIANVIGGLAIWGTINKSGPFAIDDQLVTLGLLYSFLGTLVFLAMILSAVMRENRDAKIQLKAANEDMEEKVSARTTELLTLAMEITKGKEKAEVANQAKSLFLANMSHEIRTPLSSITGYAEILLQQNTSYEQKVKFIETIWRNGKHLSSLIDDLLDLSKIESGKLDIVKQPMNVAEVIESTMSVLRIRALEKGIFVLVRTSELVPVDIESDPLLLRQIMINIIGNAIKFTEKGGIKVHIDYQKCADSDEYKLEISVEDSGCGIPDILHSNLFVPFSQGDPSISRRYGGTGLGLILSRDLARALGGDVVLKSSVPGTGTTMLITLIAAPIVSVPVKSDQNQLDLLSENPAKNQRNSLAGKKVLVVEDSPDNRVLLEHVLTRAGATVDTAEDGILGEYCAIKNRYDIILLDIQMPRQDGYTTVRHLRNYGIQTPIVAFTAHSLKNERERCLKEGCNEYLSKATSPSEIILKLANWYQ